MKLLGRNYFNELPKLVKLLNHVKNNDQLSLCVEDDSSSSNDRGDTNYLSVTEIFAIKLTFFIYKYF